MASGIIRASVCGSARFQAVKSVRSVGAQPRTTLLRAISNSANSMSSGAPLLARSALFKLGLPAILLLSLAHSAAATQARNVLGGPLEVCCTSPMTGFHRDGYCRVGPGDYGVHAVCAQVTQEFLDFTASRGNDLSSVVSAGQRWCLCVSRWKEAKDAGKAPPIVLESTSEDALQLVPLEELQQYALKKEGSEL